MKTQKLLRPIKNFEALIFTTINSTTAVQAQKKKKFNSFSSAKNTARGVRFLRGFHMYLFLAQF